MGENRDSHVPFVSVIMPVRNEASRIHASVKAVLAQDYPLERLEVLVADGDSDDGTRAIIEQLTRTHPGVQLVTNPRRFMAAGFNAALRRARGDVIVMLGGHTLLDRSYVRSCVTGLQDGKAECVGGVVETVCDTRGSEAVALAMGSRFGVGGARFRTGTESEMYVDTVAFGAYTREAIERTGPLDEELIRGQDDEYNYRFRKLGGRILLTPDARCTYFSRASMRSLFRQYFLYGFWKVRVMQKHPAQMRPRQFVPPVFVAALVLPLFVATAWLPALWISAGVAGLYAIANLAASISLARSTEGRSVLRLPLAFATLHVSYGLGFLVGSFRFARGWVRR